RAQQAPDVTSLGRPRPADNVPTACVPPLRRALPPPLAAAPLGLAAPFLRRSQNDARLLASGPHYRIRLLASPPSRDRDQNRQCCSIAPTAGLPPSMWRSSPRRACRMRIPMRITTCESLSTASS